MDLIEKLTAFFERLPGIGPRQAKRCVFALLEKDESFIQNFSNSILKLKANIKRCALCFYTFESVETRENECQICKNINKDQNLIMVVQKEIDLENIEKSKCYNGKYFVLGGSISLLDKEGVKKIRMKELFERIKNDLKITEIILALNADKEGEATSLYIKRIMEPFEKQRNLKITGFARGLSSGTEIEYSDKDTLQNAFINRK